MVNWERVAAILPVKAKAHGVSYTESSDFLDARIRDAYRKLWDPVVLPVARPRIAFEEAWLELVSAAETVTNVGSK